MTTRMIHPLHGATHAYGESDIKRLEGLGWAVEAPPVAIADATKEWDGTPGVMGETIVVPAPEKRKPGRPRRNP